MNQIVFQVALYYLYTVEPVLSYTPKDQGNVSDWTGCWKTRVLLLDSINLQKFNNGRTFASLIDVGWFK